VFTVRFAKGVEKDLKALKAYDRARVLDVIGRHLSHAPTTPARNRKLLVNLIPPWTAEPPIWELRVGTFRIFYDVSVQEQIVYVRAIRRKAAGETTGDIL
jgi:mRNA-degrading endonuclease RelE of RelBE toxin-antitoxin system